MAGKPVLAGNICTAASIFGNHAYEGKYFLAGKRRDMVRKAPAFFTIFAVFQSRIVSIPYSISNGLMGFPMRRFWNWWRVCLIPGDNYDTLPVLGNTIVCRINNAWLEPVTEAIKPLS